MRLLALTPKHASDSLRSWAAEDSRYQHENYIRA